MLRQFCRPWHFFETVVDRSLLSERVSILRFYIFTTIGESRLIDRWLTGGHWQDKAQDLKQNGRVWWVPTIRNVQIMIGPDKGHSCNLLLPLLVIIWIGVGTLWLGVWTAGLRSNCLEGGCYLQISKAVPMLRQGNSASWEWTSSFLNSPNNGNYDILWLCIDQTTSNKLLAVLAVGCWLERYKLFLDERFPLLLASQVLALELRRLSFRPDAQNISECF